MIALRRSDHKTCVISGGLYKNRHLIMAPISSNNHLILDRPALNTMTRASLTNTTGKEPYMQCSVCKKTQHEVFDMQNENYVFRCAKSKRGLQRGVVYCLYCADDLETAYLNSLPPDPRDHPDYEAGMQAIHGHWETVSR
jgi:hypothetical protein